MEAEKFDRIKAKLDADLDSLPQGAMVGIKMGWNLYTEFKDRNLLKPKLADMIMVLWVIPSYRDNFVSDMFDIEDDAYEVGTPNT